MLTENIERLIRQTPNNHPVLFLAMLNMGDHACTLFSIERHTPELIKQPVELHQVLTDVAAVWAAKILWLALTVIGLIECGESDLSVFRRLLPIVKGNLWGWVFLTFSLLLQCILSSSFFHAYPTPTASLRSRLRTLTHLKRVIQWFLVHLPSCEAISIIQIQSIFIIRVRSLMAPCSHLILTPTLTATNLRSVDFSLQRISRKWDHTVCSPFCLASFTSPTVFEIPPWYIPHVMVSLSFLLNSLVWFFLLELRADRWWWDQRAYTGLTGISGGIFDCHSWNGSWYGLW